MADNHGNTCGEEVTEEDLYYNVGARRDELKPSTDSAYLAEDQEYYNVDPGEGTNSQDVTDEPLYGNTQPFSPSRDEQNAADVTTDEYYGNVGSFAHSEPEVGTEGQSPEAVDTDEYYGNVGDPRVPAPNARPESSSESEAADDDSNYGEVGGPELLPGSGTGNARATVQTSSVYSNPDDEEYADAFSETRRAAPPPPPPAAAGVEAYQSASDYTVPKPPPSSYTTPRTTDSTHSYTATTEPSPAYYSQPKDTEDNAYIPLEDDDAPGDRMYNEVSDARPDRPGIPTPDPTYDAVDDDRGERRGATGGGQYHHLESTNTKAAENDYDKAETMRPEMRKKSDGKRQPNRKSRMSQYVSRRVTQMWQDRRKQVCWRCDRCMLCMLLVILVVVAIGLGVTIFFTIVLDDLQCASNPCRNNGTCADDTGYISCTCASGFNGDSCEIDIDECSSGPCFNNGTCHDKPNKFLCVCEQGYTGMTCEETVDACVIDPCTEGATCVPQGSTGFICVCPAGSTGTICETDTI